ncbi:SRPBCC family protein [Streptacidiphilus melanogenes]|uniref:SRPBCC family protein n=1 Tax=Streptacidiphilus melanogenes TaxID=411235 RepID=UPI0005A631F7|nr:SRPBCC family protein [Streptacidiphilus melanogenes]
MLTLGRTTQISSAAPAAFFDRWADMATWPEWNADTEWVRLDGPFAAGSTGVLKPKGGPKTKFVITELTDRVFVDVSLLAGARLTFHHAIAPTAAGGSEVSVTVTLGGPLARLWNLILGKGIAASLDRDLAALARVAEAALAGGSRATTDAA